MWQHENQSRIIDPSPNPDQVPGPDQIPEPEPLPMPPPGTEPDPIPEPEPGPPPNPIPNPMPVPQMSSSPERIPGESEGDAEERGAKIWKERPPSGPRIEEGGTEWTPDTQGWPGDQPVQQDSLQERPSGE